MSRNTHKNVGLKDGFLNPCPKLLNCVCSQYPQEQKYFQAPWKYKVSESEAMKLLSTVLSAERHYSIKEHTESYMHIEVTVPLFGFIDDLEFFLPEAGGQIHYRSASRLGTWDFGLNRLRLKKIKKKLQSAGLELY